MIGWLPVWARSALVLGLAATCAYYVLANALDILMRRWSRRHGCPVCGAGATGPDSEPAAPAVSAPAGDGG